MTALLLTFFACSGGSVSVDDSGDTADTEEPEPDPVPDNARYTAELTWSLDSVVDSWDCTDTSIETGEPVSDEDMLEAMAEVCPLCDYFYVATQDEAPCDGDLNVPDPDYRGVVLGETAAQLYQLEEDDGEFEAIPLDMAAAYDGWTLSFSAVPFEIWGTDLNVSGTWEFPGMIPEDD
jgi:hypothetical protein